MVLKLKQMRPVLSLLALLAMLFVFSSVKAASGPPTITRFSPKTGSGGSNLTIIGSNFNGTTSVLFTSASGAVAATSFTVSGNTTIKTTVPITATTGPVKVTTPSGSTTSASVFTVQEPNRPYVSIKGDVFTGGWFDNGYESCQDEINNDPGFAALYQSPSAFNGTYQNPNSVNEGGVLTYQYPNSNGTFTGSSADYGAWAMGIVSADSSKYFGFASDQAIANQKTNQVLTFGNTGTNDPSNGHFYKPDGFGGGLLAGAEQKTHCIPDYFHTKQQSPKSWAASNNLSTVGSGQYIASVGVGSVLNLNTSASKISAGKDITLFVTGDVYVGNNITYDSYKINTVPHFALVVLGSIFVGPNVTQLNGFYIAQPEVDSSHNASEGAFWTCHPSSTASYNNSQIYQNCAKQLIVTGGVIARQVNLLRIGGSITTANQPAEIFSYPPEAAVGGPFFNQSTSGNDIQIDSLVNLPPIF